MHTAGNFEFDIWYTGFILKIMSQITMEISSELSSSITKRNIKWTNKFHL